MHHDPRQHRDLKARYGIPDSAIVWHGDWVRDYMGRLLPLADDIQRHWEFNKADPRPSQPMRSRFRKNAEKALRERGRLSHAVLLIMDEAREMNLRPCLGFSDLITRETGVQTLVWMPLSEFSKAPRMRGGIPTESKAFRRLRHQRNRETDRETRKAIKRYEAEREKSQNRTDAIAAFKLAQGIPKDAAWCRDGKCDRFFVTDASRVPEGTQPCYRCYVLKKQTRYRVSDRFETIPGV